MKINIEYPDDFALSGFAKDTFETLVIMMFGGGFFDIYRFDSAMKLLGVNEQTIEESHKKYDPLHRIQIADFKPEFLTKFLKEIGDSLGGIGLMPEDGKDKKTESTWWSRIVFGFLVLFVVAFIYFSAGNSDEVNKSYAATYIQATPRTEGDEISSLFATVPKAPAERTTIQEAPSVTDAAPPIKDWSNSMPVPITKEIPPTSTGKGFLAELLSKVQSDDAITLTMKHGEVVKITIK